MHDPPATGGEQGAAVLSVNGLRKRYGSVKALDGFDLAVAPGEVTGLLGHNGAGKTTFVEVVSGLVRPDAGTVRISGIDALQSARAGRAARSLVGVAPQQQAVYLSASVRENLRLYASLLGLAGRAALREIDAVADELMLADVIDRPVGLLSGGQRRRVQAASALLGSPPLLLLDEPTVGADPQTRQALLAAVRARAAAGAAVVYTTHYLPELVDLGATLAVARDGQVVARGTQAELLADLPARLEVTFAGPVPAELVGRGEVASRDGTEGDAVLTLRTAHPTSALAEIVSRGYVLRGVDVRHATLDDLFAALRQTRPGVDHAA